jgi:hypothetical protein
VAAVTAVGLGLGALVLAKWLFPGPRPGLAWTLATGLGRAELQARINEIQDKAIASSPLSAEDKSFLADFYRTLATGGKLTIAVRQTGRLMDHYLDGSGAAFALEPTIFAENAKVQRQIDKLKEQATRAPCTPGKAWSSPKFYMPDASRTDSVFGLYWGTVRVTQVGSEGLECRLRYRAEVPWTWPSYAELQARYGTPHGESFPLPNAMSLLFGADHALYVDNGLGHHLSTVGLAREFVAYAEWDG